MRTTLRSISFLVLGLLAGSSPLFAHHGNASYDTSKTVTVTGTVSEYHWANPHIWLKVDVKDANGNIAHWVLESENPVNQANAGWSPSTFKPGDQVAIDATPAKNGAPFGRVKGRIVINGQVFKARRLRLRARSVDLAAIVLGALIGVAEHRIGRRHLLEPLLGLFVAGVQIRMQLLGEPPIGLLNLALRRILGDAQHAIRVGGQAGLLGRMFDRLGSF